MDTPTLPGVISHHASGFGRITRQPITAAPSPSSDALVEASRPSQGRRSADLAMGDMGPGTRSRPDRDKEQATAPLSGINREGHRHAPPGNAGNGLAAWSLGGSVRRHGFGRLMFIGTAHDGNARAVAPNGSGRVIAAVSERSVHGVILGSASAPQLLTSEQPAMQRNRITTQTIEEIEDVIDVIEVIFADGIVEPHELELLRHEVSEAHYAAGYADASLAAALSIARTGPDSRRSRDTMRDVADLARYRDEKRHCHRGNGDSAA